MCTGSSTCLVPVLVLVPFWLKPKSVTTRAYSSLPSASLKRLLDHVGHPCTADSLGSQASSAWTSLALVLSLEGSHKPNSLELGWFGLSAPLSLSPQDTILNGTRKLFVGHNFGGFIISFCVKQKLSLSSCRAFSQPCVSVSLSCLICECR